MCQVGFVASPQSHRGPAAKNEKLLGPKQLPALRAATHDLCWLLDHGYASHSAMRKYPQQIILVETAEALAAFPVQSGCVTVLSIMPSGHARKISYWNPATGGGCSARLCRISHTVEGEYNPSASNRASSPESRFHLFFTAIPSAFHCPICTTRYLPGVMPASDSD